MSRLLISLLACACLPAVAAEKASPRFEITPFIGLRGGGDFDLDIASQNLAIDTAGSFALALNMRIDEDSQYELFYGRQSTNIEHGSPLGNVDVDVEYLHVGGAAEWHDEYRLVPYIVGGVGVTRFHPAFSGADDETRFSLSLGGGVRVPVNERFSLRLEGRGYLTLVDTDTAFFCRSDQTGALCRIRGSGSTFAQYELLAGAAVAF